HCPESFEKLTQLVNRNFFETRRDFEKYAELFPQSFLSRISLLGSDGHWLDAGSGEGFALQDLFNQTVIDPEAVIKEADSSFWRKRKILIDPVNLQESAQRLNFRSPEDKPKITGITYKMERPDPKIPNLTFKIGRFFEEIPLNEFAQADLITDLYGVISYTPRLDEVLRRYHALLKDSGRAYLFIGDYLTVPQHIWTRRVERIGEEGWYSPFVNSTVKKADGSTVSLLDWIQSLPDFYAEVEKVVIQQPKRGNLVPGQIERSTLVLEKKTGHSNIPSLKLVESDEGKPPVRKFEEVP
ncbi:MAG: hypothetical protein EBQ92_12525, partial [Proteobacteria bacterium]|nr:hypothetical protein [Pseudomonadota bacterium]